MVLQGKYYPELAGHCWLHGHGDIVAAANLLHEKKLLLLNAKKKKKKKKYEEDRSGFLRVKYPPFKLFNR